MERSGRRGFDSLSGSSRWLNAASLEHLSARSLTQAQPLLGTAPRRVLGKQLWNNVRLFSNKILMVRNLWEGAVETFTQGSNEVLLFLMKTLYYPDTRYIIIEY